MKKLITLLAVIGYALLVVPAYAADVYMEADYNAIWDNLDQDVTSVGTGIAFHPTENLMIDVGADYIVNNDLSHSGHIDTADFNRREKNQRIYHRQLEDAWTVGIKARWNFWSF